MNRKTLLALGFGAAALALLVCPGLLPAAAVARGGAGDPPAGRPGDPAPRIDPRKGAIYFEQAVRWVNDGKQGIHKLSDFYADLADVKFSVGTNRHEGCMRLWLRSPDKYRIELRPGKPMRRLTTKILDKDRMWVIHPPPNSRVQPMHGRPGGAEAIRQMQNDRRRLMDLATFLTLEGLKGPSVQFINEGPKTGSGTFKGDWLKVRRKIPNGAEVTFHLAYGKDPRDPTGRALLATYPGIVTIIGDPERREPTEYYVLKHWKRGPQFRYPQRIEAYSQERPGARMGRFLLAFPNDIRINTKLPDSTFAPPQR